MNEQPMKREELRQRMADYLGDELDPRKRGSFEQGLEDHPDLAAEVRSLQMALEAMRSLDEASSPESIREPEPAMNSRATFRGGHLLRFAALIALAFVLGYVVKGMEPVSTPAENDAINAPDVPQPNQEADIFRTRLAEHYLSDRKRSGFGRSLIAYARATKKQGP